MASGATNHTHEAMHTSKVFLLMANKSKTVTIPENWNDILMYLPVETVAAIHGRSIPSIWRDVKSGAIPAPIKVGNSTRWNSLELKAALDGAGGVTDMHRSKARARANGEKHGEAA